MKSLAIALCLALLSACTGLSVQEHKTDAWGLDNSIEGVTFKTVEVYKHNMMGPSYQYVILLQCDAEGQNCKRAAEQPLITPGMVSSLIAPMIQAGAIMGGAAILSEGMRKSGSTNNLNNGSSSDSNSASSSGAFSSSRSNSSSRATGGNASGNSLGNVNVNTGSANGQGGIIQQ